MTLPLYPIESVVPQRPPMILIDEIVARAGRRASSFCVTIRPTVLFFQPGRGVPSHVALEWMAQACAAFAGCEAIDERQRGQDRLSARNARFLRRQSPGSRRASVCTSSALEYRDNEAANFACEVAGSPEGVSLARASLNVYQPHDAFALIGSQAAPPS